MVTHPDVRVIVICFNFIIIVNNSYVKNSINLGLGAEGTFKGEQAAPERITMFV